jgi:signal transduction histidine kinase
MAVAAASGPARKATVFVSPLTAALSVVFICGVALMAFAVHAGLPGRQARAIVDLASTLMWMAAFLRWRSAGEGRPKLFWRLVSWGALAVVGYATSAGLSDLLGVSWLGFVAVGCLVISGVFLLAAVATRTSRAEGARAGWSTILDVGVIVLALIGPFYAFLIGPVLGSHDIRAITLSGIWIVMLFGAGAFLLAAYRTPAGWSPYGLVVLSAMMAVLTVGGLCGAFTMAMAGGLPPWWAEAIYFVGVLIGLEAPRYDHRISSDAAGLKVEQTWSMARSVLPYFVFIPLMLLTLVAGLASPANDFTKSAIATGVVVSVLVGARQLLQILDNRRLMKESRLLLETSRRNEAKIAELSKAKSEVMSNLSHEFRNALVGIQGFSEILRDQDLPPDDVKAFATDIYHDSERLTRMITELLDLDRMEAGRVRLELKPLDLNKTIVEAVERARVAGGKCCIKLQLDPALPLVPADADRILQVISNLLSNALKYSPQGGEILVKTALEGHCVHVSVKDHGIGIAPQDLTRLFHRYERIDSAGHKIGGTGLGLVICGQIVAMHGGRIWAESTPNEGSEFGFTLPLSGGSATVECQTKG